MEYLRSAVRDIEREDPCILSPDVYSPFELARVITRAWTQEYGWDITTSDLTGKVEITQYLSRYPMNSAYFYTDGTFRPPPPLPDELYEVETAIDHTFRYEPEPRDSHHNALPPSLVNLWKKARAKAKQQAPVCVVEEVLPFEEI